MEVNKVIYQKIDSLNISQNVAFCIFNAERVVHLYHLFDAMIQKENLDPLSEFSDGHLVLRKTLNQIKSVYTNLIELKSDDKTKIETYLEICDRLMPDDDDYGGYETTIAQFVCSAIRYTVSYCLKKETKYPKQISDCLFNIVNNIVSENYFRKFKDNNFAEKRKVVLNYYEREVQIQIELLNQLNDSNSLEFVGSEALRRKIDPEDYLV